MKWGSRQWMREKELDRERAKKGFFEGWEKMVETLL
jgi:hypothetical protein